MPTREYIEKKDTKVLKKRELITRKEYAERRGVAPRTIGKYVQKGYIPIYGKLLDPVEADMLLAEILVMPLGSGNNSKNTGKRKVAPETLDEDDGIDPYSYGAQRTKEKALKVQLLEMDVKLKQGLMVLTKDVEYAAFTSAREVRDRMLNIPDRIAAIVAAESDEIKVRTIIMTQIENELESISKKG